MKSTREERARWERDAREAARADAASGHPVIDHRVLELTWLAMARINEDPSLVRIGRENIERWTRQNDGYLSRFHAEWLALIERHSWEELREMPLEESDEGQRLRSSHPFTGLVTEAERNAIDDATRSLSKATLAKKNGAGRPGGGTARARRVGCSRAYATGSRARSGGHGGHSATRPRSVRG